MGAIDSWSVGCIFAEILGRKPLFPGFDTQHQLKLIIECLGTPASEILPNMSNAKCRKFIKSLPLTMARSWQTTINKPEVGAEALDLLSKMLCFAPDKRVTVEQAL